MSEVVINRVSSHKRTSMGSVGENGHTLNKKVEGLGMYTFAHGKGSKRKSFTRHCSEAEAKSIRDSL